MKTPRKVSTVVKKATPQHTLDAIRWKAFIKASGTPVNELSEEWLLFFDAQAEIATASNELVKLVDKAIEKDIELEGGK